MNTFKKILATALTSIASLLIVGTVYAAPYQPFQGGTGTTTTPTTGQVLVGQSSGIYAPQATSTLGLPTFLTLTNYATTSPALGFFNSTSTTATSTTHLFSVDTAFNFLGDYITNVATWFTSRFNANFAVQTTDNLSEGSTNKYQHVGGASSTVQYNCNGSLCGNATLSFNGTSVTVPNLIVSGSTTISGALSANIIPLQDTAANLSGVIASSGQAVYETDTKCQKVGDGSTNIGGLGCIYNAYATTTWTRPMTITAFNYSQPQIGSSYWTVPGVSLPPFVSFASTSQYNQIGPSEYQLFTGANPGAFLLHGAMSTTSATQTGLPGGAIQVISGGPDTAIDTAGQAANSGVAFFNTSQAQNSKVATSTVSNTGGTSGAMNITTGSGGSAGNSTISINGGNNGGKSGAITFGTGSGGSANTTASSTNVGGDSGTVSNSSGNGGGVLGGTSGKSGNVQFVSGSSGAGGTGSLNATTSVSGNVIIGSGNTGSITFTANTTPYGHISSPGLLTLKGGNTGAFSGASTTLTIMDQAGSILITGGSGGTITGGGSVIGSQGGKVTISGGAGSIGTTTNGGDVAIGGGIGKSGGTNGELLLGVTATSSATSSQAFGNVLIGASGVKTLASGTSGSITLPTNVVLTASSSIFLTLQNCSNCGTLYVSATSSSAFTISSTNILDASIAAWVLIDHP